MARSRNNGRGSDEATPLPKLCRKRLIVCFDGTWNNADNGGNPTNVVRLARAIPATGSDGVPQVVYYESGVGTGIFDKFVGGIFGHGLEQNVKDGYLFLAHNYCGEDDHHAADEIYVFGFSRGAYTARSLCGFIGACKGLLNPRSLHKLERAWKFYRTNPEKRNKFEHYEEIEQDVRTNVKIDCLGIWDTVGALGIPGTVFQIFNRRRYAFHDTELSWMVRHAFHALAIDEKRNPFVPSVWQRPKQPMPGQIVEQVWFPGVHSNVGGSYPDTDIADLTLRWMIARLVAHTGVTISPDTLKYLIPEKYQKDGKTPDPAAIQRIRDKWLGAIYESRSFPAYVWDRIAPTVRVVAGQLPPRRSLLNRQFPKRGGVPFEEAIHWSAADRYNGWRASNIKPYAPVNLTWAWPEVAQSRVKLATFESETLPGKPWSVPEARSPSFQAAAPIDRSMQSAAEPIIAPAALQASHETQPPAAGRSPRATRVPRWRGRGSTTPGA